MITSNDIALDNLGWVDHGAIWTYDLAKRSYELAAIPGSTFLGLSHSESRFFRVVHHGDPSEAISIREVERPLLECASVRRLNGGFVFTGDLELWNLVENAALISGSAKQRLVVIDAEAREVRELDLSWYNADNYDLGYQGLVGCMSLPGKKHVVVAVQRSSTLIVVDRTDGRVVTKISLAGAAGNPSMQLLSDRDLLSVDYDTLCRVDLAAGQMVASLRLQMGSSSVDRQFVGDLAMTSDGNAAVARPFSGDVALIDLDRFELCGQVKVGGQPLSLGCSRDLLITRDWQTGAVRTAGIHGER